jgi:hypothetical protein
MIQINLVDNTNKVKHVEFHVVPVTKEEDFTCIPDDFLPFRRIERLSHKLKAGRVFGHIGTYVWYRLAGAPHVGHKRSLSKQP